MVDWAGNVLQAGVPSRLVTDRQDPTTVQGWITRAVVIGVTYPDEDTRAAPGVIEDQQRNVLCDVRTYGRYTRILRHVPMLQHVTGLHDEDIYVPRAPKVTLDGSDLVVGYAIDGLPPPTAAELLDGDHVLVGFLDNDPKQPVILPYTLGHPKAKNRATKEQGRRRRLRHAGTVVEWTEDGDLTIDATNAAQADLAVGGEASVRETGQKVTITTGTQQIEIVKGTRVKISSGGTTIDVTPSQIASTVGPSKITETGQKIDVVTPTFSVITSSGAIDMASGSAMSLTAQTAVILGDADLATRGALIKFSPGAMELGWNGLVSQLQLSIPVLQALPPATPILASHLSGLISVLTQLLVASQGMTGSGQCSKVFGV